jgi:hypothetical protein
METTEYNLLAKADAVVSPGKVTTTNKDVSQGPAPSALTGNAKPLDKINFEVKAPLSKGLTISGETLNQIAAEAREVKTHVKLKLVGTLVFVEKGKKALYNQKILIAYPGVIEKNALTAWYRDQFKDFQIKFLRVGHCRGLTLVLIDYGKAIQRRNLDCFTYDDVLASVFKLIKNEWNDALVILAEDLENKDLKVTKNIMEQLSECKTVGEAIAKCAKKFGDVNGVVAAYSFVNREKTFDPLKGKKLHPWQVKIKAVLETKANNRVVYWIYNPPGRAGKTHFCQHLANIWGRDVHMQNDISSFRDTATVIAGAFEMGWTGKIMLLNLNRAAEAYKIYNTLEALKDAWITATKYKGRNMTWESGHVIVFANWLPFIDQLSEDRWGVHKLCAPLTPKGQIPKPYGAADMFLKLIPPNEVEALRIKDQNDRNCQPVEVNTPRVNIDHVIVEDFIKKNVELDYTDSDNEIRVETTLRCEDIYAAYQIKHSEIAVKYEEFLTLALDILGRQVNNVWLGAKLVKVQ